jgi:integrase
LTEEQAKRFREVTRNDRFGALYVLALTTGMREGELLGLRWRDIDFDQQRLQVLMNVQETPKEYVHGETKTAYSRRSIALTPTALAALREHRVKQDEECQALGPAWKNALDLVFPNRYGGIMIPHNLAKRSFKRHLATTGLSDEIRFHDLRHTAATLMLSRGVHPKVVSEILGHADISITLRIYAHVTPHMQQAAVDVMEHVFGARSAS